MIHNNKLYVEAIMCGTVIDHIPAKIGFKLLMLFKFTETEQKITIGFNLPSSVMEKKDLIKIENTFLTEQQINQLALYAPHATVNCIDQYLVVRKTYPNLPECVENILICPNSNCISIIEPIPSNFLIKKHSGNILLKCKFCEKEFSQYVVLNN